MMSNPVASAVANGNPPPSALRAASARSRLPLAPRLTTTSTSPRTTATLQRAASSGARRSVSPSREATESGSGGNETSADDVWKPYGQHSSTDRKDTARLTHAHSPSRAKIEILAQFRADGHFRGDVVVRCGAYVFYVHKAVLYFASPFFQSIFDGDWKETHLSIHTISCASSDAGYKEDDGGDGGQAGTRDKDRLRNPTYNDDTIHPDSESDSEDAIVSRCNLSSRRASYYTAPVVLDRQHLRTSCDSERSSVITPVIRDIDGAEANESGRGEPTPPTDQAEHVPEPSISAGGQRSDDLIERLERLATPPLPDSRDGAREQPDDVPESSTSQTKESTPHMSRGGETKEKKRDSRRRDKLGNVTAIIDLSEEDPGTFQDVLCHIYPNLELQVTWLNTRSLFSFADKFGVPHLRRACTTFLRAALAGRPIEAMALSELYGIEDVYREASRHVLDNMPSWDPDDLALLGQETLLKLERKRTWFLERLLKLGLAQPARDYECHAKCSDPQTCANSLHERWHAQYAAAFKYGPPQPSIIWRYLRELETVSGVSGASGTATLACQASSKAWAQNLFDRMYGLPSHQHTGRASQKFLAIKLSHPEPHRPRARRVNTTEALHTMPITR